MYAGYQTGATLTLTGHLQLRVVGTWNGTVYVVDQTVSGDAVTGTSTIETTPLLMPEYPAEDSAVGTRDYPTLPSPYTYYNQQETVKLVLSRTLTDNAGGFFNSVWLGDTAGGSSYVWAACGGGSFLIDAYSGTSRTSNETWSDGTGYGSYPVGTEGEASWDRYGSGTRSGVKLVFADYPSLPYGLTTSHSPWAGAYDATFRTDFTLTIEHQMSVSSPDGTVYPPGGGDPSTTQPVSLATDRTGHSLRGYIQAADVYTERRTLTNWTAIANRAGKQPAVYWWYGQEHCIYVNGTDSIRDWDCRAGTEVTLVTGTHPCVAVNAACSMRAVAYRVGTAYKITVYGGYGTAISCGTPPATEHTVLASGAPDAAGSLAWRLDGTLEFTYSDGSSLHTLTSSDLGANWT